jgi:hypothetical protein
MDYGVKVGNECHQKAYYKAWGYINTLAAILAGVFLFVFVASGAVLGGCWYWKKLKEKENNVLNN